jgi:hypothetical protein
VTGRVKECSLFVDLRLLLLEDLLRSLDLFCAELKLHLDYLLYSRNILRLMAGENNASRSIQRHSIIIIIKLSPSGEDDTPAVPACADRRCPLHFAAGIPQSHVGGTCFRADCLRGGGSSGGG